MHSLPDLPYPLDALVPHLSADTLEHHWGRHHRAYVDALNRLVTGTPLADLKLEDLVRRSSGSVFNNAAQHYNHSLYWQSLSPNGGGEPKRALAEAINERYGSFHALRAAFTEQAVAHFGSGWAWLVKKRDDTVRVELTHDAACPLARGDSPLLVCDLWEHAYYVDYRNMRGRYIEAFWTLVDWAGAERRFRDPRLRSSGVASETRTSAAGTHGGPGC